MSGEMIRETRRKDVVRAFCRSILVVDDEIYEEQSGVGASHGGVTGAVPDIVKQRVLSPRYAAVHGGCEEKGVLCHLFHYPNALEQEHVGVVTSKAVELARRSDVLVIDWFLGMAGAPDRSLEILTKLARDKAFRYVVIYSTENPTAIETTLKGFGIFSRLKRVELEQHRETAAPTAEVVEEDDDPIIAPEAGDDQTVNEATVQMGHGAGTPINLHLDGRFFISIHQKHEIDLDAEHVLHDLQATLAAALPDQLHWAGLEFTGRARELFPRVLAALPLGVDRALQFQALFETKNGVSARVAEVLLDELRLALEAAPLQQVFDDVLFEPVKQEMGALASDNEAAQAKAWELCKRLAPSKEQTILREEFDSRWAELWSWLTQAWGDARVDRVREAVGSTDACRKYFPHLLDPNGKKLIGDVIAHYIGGENATEALDESATRWAALRESVLLPCNDGVDTGYIFEDLQAKEADTRWLLCISPLCDCARPGEGYIFVKGEEIPVADLRESLSKETQSAFIKRNTSGSMAVFHHVAWQATSIRFIRTSDIKNKDLYSLAGALRLEFVNRIVQRVYGWQSRLGVDTSEWLRRRRNER